MPVEWWLSRLCEEFPGRLPSEVLAEWQQAPCGLLETMCEMRAFAATKQQCDAAKTREDRPRTAMAALVTEIEFAEAEQALRRAHGHAHD